MWTSFPFFGWGIVTGWQSQLLSGVWKIKQLKKKMKTLEAQHQKGTDQGIYSTQNLTYHNTEVF